MASKSPFVKKTMKRRQPSSPTVGGLAIAGRASYGNSSTDNSSEIRERKAARLIDSFDSPWFANGLLLASGVIAGFIEFFTHLAVGHMKATAEYHAFIDAGVIALMTIALVGVCFASARARRQRTLERIRTASDLNHHVRNALQVITLSRYLPEEKQSQAVYTSIDRIDEALKRLSPQ